VEPSRTGSQNQTERLQKTACTSLSRLTIVAAPIDHRRNPAKAAQPDANPLLCRRDEHLQSAARE